MSNMKKVMKVLKKIPWMAVGTVFLFLLAIFAMMKGSINNKQAVGASAPGICFEGDYRIGEGEWNKITEGKHIPATQGDVTLRGRFHEMTPDGKYLKPAGKGIPVAFFLDHVRITVYESGKNPYPMFNEHPAVGASGCGEIWLPYTLQGETDEPMEIVIHNPHVFGNETAIDSFLSGVAWWTGADFKAEVLARGEFHRNLGLLLCIGSIALLGLALFSTLIRIQKNAPLWLFGLVTFFAGIYYAYHAPGAYFWSELIAVNTWATGISAMYYMLFASAAVAFFVIKTKKIVRAVAGAIGFADTVLIVLPILTDLRFYDMMLPWALVQSVGNLILIGCLIRECVSANWKERLAYGGMGVVLAAFEIDAVATLLGLWKGGASSEYVFIVLFAAVFAMVMFVIPQKIRALNKAKDLELQRSRLEIEKNAIEAELKASRVAIMLSQIRPHFIYNTLGTIERLCIKDPEKAFDLVRNFSLYLRGNFSELDSVAPISFSEEIQHVQYYVNIEKVRFPDMTIEYQLDFSDFTLPAISVQPLVENAIKHGLMPLETGGKVVIRSYETDTHFCVEVSDNGVGFDTEVLLNKKEHVGLNNIRERLKAIVNGDLTVESTVGSGTTATIKIPKEDIV